MAAESECEIRFYFFFPFSMETIKASLCHAHANFRADGDLQNADRFSSSLYRFPLKSVAESDPRAQNSSSNPFWYETDDLVVVPCGCRCTSAASCQLISFGYRAAELALLRTD